MVLSRPGSSGLVAVEQPTDTEHALLLGFGLVERGDLAGAERMRQLTAYGAKGNVTLLERPFRPGTLLSAVEVAMRSRKRQYEVRNLLTQLVVLHAPDDVRVAGAAEDEDGLPPMSETPASGAVLSVGATTGAGLTFGSR